MTSHSPTQSAAQPRPDESAGEPRRRAGVAPTSGGPVAALRHTLILTWRNLLVIARTPEALLPPIAISVFFLVIYDSTLGRASSFLPELSGTDYIGFILPLSVVSASLSGAGIAAQNVVRDIESGYFDKLQLTPVSRSALLLGPMFAGAIVLGVQTLIVIAVGLLMGLSPATGPLGLLVVMLLSIMLGSGFAGFTVSAALGSGNAAATQGASFIFFPLTFITASFVPLDLLDGWLKTAAMFNPITYVLEAMRGLLIGGWDGVELLKGFGATAILAVVMYALAAFALRVRVRRT